MNTLLGLEELGERLATVDTMLMALVKRRMELAQQVGLTKRRKREDIFNAAREEGRIAKVKNWAVEHDLNPNFTAALLYLIIGESCKLQMIQLQKEALRDAELQTEDEWYGELQKNLLLLTERWCSSYDSDYEKNAFATRDYLRFEKGVMDHEISLVRDKGSAVDLGCATGRLTRVLAECFEHATGYDISPHMIATARENAAKHGVGLKTSFSGIDVEKGIPVGDQTASFVVMNLGTASDVRNIGHVIRETLRVLKKGGRFFFSFYNRAALLYRWEFLPWPVGLVASINLHKHCLEVRSRAEVLEVYARPYSTAEVGALFKEAGVETGICTYPTLSAILPDELFEGHIAIQEAVRTIDENLQTSPMGAYIVATGEK